MNTASSTEPVFGNDRNIPIELLDLRFRWRRDMPLTLSIPEFTVFCGERLFVAGPSGSGKSTLLSLLAGVILPEAGEVRILGQNLAELGAAARDRFRADRIGFIFQMFNLIPYLSVIENATLPCRFSARRHDNAVRRSGSPEAEAKRLLAHLDIGQDDLLHRRASELSVGQQQRVAAARALMGAPEILIADEPTSSLDADRREAFIRLLLGECADQGTTLVFVSHDHSLEKLFDRVFRLPEPSH